MGRVHPYESKTNQELLELSYSDDSEVDDDEDAESAWAAIRQLRKRNTDEIFQLAKQSCASPRARHRQRGLQVLAQLGGREHPRLDESVEIAIEALRDADQTVVEAAAWALAHLDGQRSKGALMTLEDHPSSEIRHAVAFGLAGGPVTGSIPALLRLMEDPEDTVRNWATFSLGLNPEHDTSEIREAFRRRLSDPFVEARDEAIWALALRNDQQGLRILLNRLESDSWIAGDEYAACDILGLYSTDKPSNARLCEGIRALLAG